MTVLYRKGQRSLAIHPTAIIDKEAHIPASAEIGPYVVIDGPVQLGERVKVYPHAYLSGWTEIGDDCEIHTHTVIGHLPQDFHFTGGRSYCRIGARTTIREGASIHRGTDPESETRVGSDCLLLANCHLGHNVCLEDHVKILNSAMISGHVHIQDHAIVSGGSGVHQFVRIGRYAMIGGMTRVPTDVLPYMTLEGDAICIGYNSIGLRRSEAFTKEEINEVRLAYRMIYRSREPFATAVAAFGDVAKERTGRDIMAFYNARGKRAFAKRPPRSAHLADSRPSP